jgi:hypothetical protein
VLFSAPALSTSYPAKPVDSAAELQRLFLSPPSEYRTLPFFVWNGEVTEADIDRYLLDFHKQGVGGVFIHPRPGMITEYLSDRWFSLCKYTIDRAAKLGMQAWLYDENSYPSGFAGGHVPASMPESYNQGQSLTPEKLKRIDPANAAKYFLVLKRTGDSYTEVPAAAAAAPGDYYAFTLAFYPKQAWMGGFSYVDLIKPGVTEKFIEITMRGYEKTLGPQLGGKTTPGIFTDEPNINPPGRRSLRWTPDLFAQFQKRWGYDLKPVLPSLYEETGNWRKVRHDYYGTLLELFIGRWSKPWREYSDAKGFVWTGHYWEHAWPNPAHGPDNMAMYAWHQVPAIDMLFNQFREDVNAQFGNVRAVKELASVANQLGYRRTLSETYGGGGWELRFEDQKRLGDWQAALGVNLINQHLAFGTLMGARKYDYPQSFTYHTPWWNHYKALGDYFGRVSLAVATGEQINKVLVLEPTTSAWMYGSPGGVGPRMMQIGSAFQEFITRLESLQGEYDLGSEDIIARHGRIEGAKFVVGKRGYDVVVLAPGTESLDAATAKLLASYVGAGGTVLSFVDAPARIDGAEDSRLTQLAAQNRNRWLRAASLDEPIARQRLLASGFSRVSGKIFHQRRKLNDGELLFVVNSSLEAPASATVAIAQPSLARFDLFSGGRETYPTVNGAAQIDLPPGGSILLIASKATAPAAPVVADLEPIATSAPLSVRRTQPNALRIDYLDLKLGASTDRDIYFYPAQEKVFQHFGLETNPWNHAVQYKTSILDKNKTLPNEGFEAAFHFEVDAGLNTATLRAVIERPQLWKVTVNGKPVTATPGQWWLDRAFGVYAIGPHVRPGANVVVITAPRMTVHHELEPIHLIGDFGVVEQPKGWKLTSLKPLSLGPWKEQRLPFYSHSVAYSRAVTFARVPAQAKVALGKWNGTMAEVKVNGKSAGVIGWQPYECEIAKLLKPGANQIEVVVYGSLKNLLGPHHGKINRGLASPWSFRNAPAQPPAGSEYDLDAYGLFEDFQVKASR